MLSTDSGNDDYFEELADKLASSKDDADLFGTIVNAPFDDPSVTTGLGLGFLSLVLVNPKTATIDRIAISKTETAQGAIDVTVKRFEDLKVPVGHRANLVNKVISSGKSQRTTDWNDLLTPVLKPEEARLNQAGAGISTSYIYPLKARSGGAIIFQFYVEPSQIGPDQTHFMKRYSRLVSEALV